MNIPLVPKNELFVASLQTTYLSEVLKIFKPEQIKRLIASGGTNVDSNSLPEHNIGMLYKESYNKHLQLDYDSDATTDLDNVALQKIDFWINRAGLKDMVVEYLKVIVPIDFDMFDKRLTGDYVLTFSNTECPNSETIRKHIVKVNKKNYENNQYQFRYRQLVLNFLMKADRVGSVKIMDYPKNSLINLPDNWKKNTDLTKFGSSTIGTENTMVAVCNSLGATCIQEKFKLSKDKTWEIDTWKN